ncbi:MAG: sodium:calcium antiporter [Alphaproteobacteria bacterium]|nr:sodium:calcium antiporter [Alphaproteobacteria bacterium]
MPSFTEFSLTINLLIFAGAAALVWFAGTKIARYADAISSKTGLGHALIGVLLLGGVTSLPEFAVTISASVTGNTALAVNNIFGGVAMQITILAAADFAIGRHALTSVVPNPVVLLQGALNIVVLSVITVGLVVTDYAVFGIGLWVWGATLIFLYGMWMLSQAEGRVPWQANMDEALEGIVEDAAADEERVERSTLRKLIMRAALAGLAILIGGFLVAKTGEALAEQTGLGASFVGAVLVAISTSLPEVSTVLAAARLGLFTLAISDILGTNLFDAALLFAVDATDQGGAALNSVSDFSVVAALLGIVVTALYLVGLAERRDKTFFRLGIDSFAVVIAYLGGLALLYTLR